MKLCTVHTFQTILDVFHATPKLWSILRNCVKISKYMYLHVDCGGDIKNAIFGTFRKQCINWHLQGKSNHYSLNIGSCILNAYGTFIYPRWVSLGMGGGGYILCYF